MFEAASRTKMPLAGENASHEEVRSVVLDERILDIIGSSTRHLGTLNSPLQRQVIKTGR